MAEILAIMVIGEKGSGGGSEEILIHTRSEAGTLKSIRWSVLLFSCKSDQRGEYRRDHVSSGGLMLRPVSFLSWGVFVQAGATEDHGDSSVCPRQQ